MLGESTLLGKSELWDDFVLPVIVVSSTDVVSIGDVTSGRDVVSETALRSENVMKSGKIVVPDDMGLSKDVVVIADVLMFDVIVRTPEDVYLINIHESGGLGADDITMRKASRS